MPVKGQMQPTFRMGLNKSQEKTGNALPWTQWTYDCIQFWWSECQKNHISRTTLDQRCPMVRSSSSYYGLHWLIEEQISREICSAVQVQSIAWGSKIRDFTKIQSLYQVQKSHPLYSDFQSSGWFHVKNANFDSSHYLLC